MCIRDSNGAMSRGEFVAFITATGLLIPPIKRLASANEFLQRGIAAAKSVFSLIDSPKERHSGSTRPSVEGKLSFKNIFFTYDKNEILRDISMEIEPGEMVAFVGPSGGGKTTLLNLVPRLYEPTSGEIFLDSRPIADYSLVNLRKNISYVAQNTILFNDTIRNNISYGIGQAASDDDIERVADLAQLGEFVNGLPNGLNSEIGDNGVKLSGGQRQRIAIARAMLKNAPILILDEATAALDNESENFIKKALANVSHGRTSLVVAHRLSTIVNSNKIVVIDNGRIIEMGTHLQLIENEGLYTKLYKQELDKK